MPNLSDISLAAFTESYGNLYPIVPASENNTYRFHLKTRWHEHGHCQEGGLDLTKASSSTVERYAQYVKYLQTIHWSEMKKVYRQTADYNAWLTFLKDVCRFDQNRCALEVQNPEVVEYSIYHIVGGKAYTVKVTNLA